jgi:formylglycine-generating enzyme required for sulfatase activity
MIARNVRFFLLAALAAFVSDIEANTSPGQEANAPMIKIPAGEFLMGSSADDVKHVKEQYGKRDLYKSHPFDEEAPKRKVFVKAFLIDTYEVTNKEYAGFVHATGHAAPKSWPGGYMDNAKESHPVTFVTYEDADAYAKWAGKRLPTAEEWEKAARGPDGRVYPWGDAFDPYKAATADSDLHALNDGQCAVGSTVKVMAAVGDVSPYGVRDMAGNVREWTATASPGDPKMGMLKGASWVDLSVNARAAHKEYVPKVSYSHIIGFRCVKDAE